MLRGGASPLPRGLAVVEPEAEALGGAAARGAACNGLQMRMSVCVYVPVVRVRVRACVRV